MRFGVVDPPNRPFVAGCGRYLLGGPLTLEEQKFVGEDLADGCSRGVYEEVTPAYVRDGVAKGYHVSSAFVDGRGGPEQLHDESKGENHKT